MIDQRRPAGPGGRMALRSRTGRAGGPAPGSFRVVDPLRDLEPDDKTPTVSVEPLLLRVMEAAAVLRIGRSKMFELMAANELPVVRLGGVVRIPYHALRRWVEERTEAA